MRNRYISHDPTTHDDTIPSEPVKAPADSKGPADGSQPSVRACPGGGRNWRLPLAAFSSQFASWPRAIAFGDGPGPGTRGESACKGAASCEPAGASRLSIYYGGCLMSRLGWEDALC